MIENFDMAEMNKFVTVLDEHCANGSRTGCNECPFNSIPCGAIKGNKLRDFAKFLHDWVEDKNAKPLTEAQVTYLKALNTLGLRYIARDSDNSIFAYYTYPRKVSFAEDGCWNSENPPLDLGYMINHSLTASAALSELCNWEDEKPLNIADSLAAGRVILCE